MYYKEAYCADKGHHPRHHFKRKFKKMMAKKMEHKRRGRFPKANIQEFDDRYELLIYAVGYTKSDFQVNLTDNTLIITAERPSQEEADYNWRRQEFRPYSFERQFELNDKIDKESIAAKYEEGILKVTLGKLKGFETVRKEVIID